MHIQKKKNRIYLDITSLRNQQPYCHTESHHFVTRSHDCLKMQGFYSSVQRESVKKNSVLESFKDGDCFCSEFHYFSLDFTRVFFLIIAVISSKRPTNKKHIILGIASRLAELKQPSLPQNWSQMADRSWWKTI